MTKKPGKYPGFFNTIFYKNQSKTRLILSLNLIKKGNNITMGDFRHTKII